MELVQNRNKIEEYRKRAEDLVAQMTLSEKVAQTMHQTPAIKRLGIKAYNWWSHLQLLYKQQFGISCTCNIIDFRLLKAKDFLTCVKDCFCVQAPFAFPQKISQDDRLYNSAYTAATFHQNHLS